MAAEPKGKTSKQRRNKRRSAHWKLAVPGMSACSKCGEMVLPHRMCKACGSYKGREVVAVEASK
jgi:large subunit ribosomal protein L32